MIIALSSLNKQYLSLFLQVLASDVIAISLKPSPFAPIITNILFHFNFKQTKYPPSYSKCPAWLKISFPIYFTDNLWTISQIHSLCVWFFNNGICTHIFFYHRIDIIMSSSKYNKVIPSYKPERYDILEMNDYADWCFNCFRTENAGSPKE